MMNTSVNAPMEANAPTRALSKAECQVEIMRIEKENNYLMSDIGQLEKRFELLQRQANVLASSRMVPDLYAGDIANCIIAINMAEQFKVNVFCLMQNMYVVHGTPAFSSKFIIAQINDSNRFTPLQYEYKDCDESSPEYGCRVKAYRKDDTNREFPLVGQWITNAMVKAEGWDKNPKWRSPIKGQMFAYRASAFWQRLYAPELTMGFISVDEAEDIHYGEQPTPLKAQKSTLQELAENAVLETKKDISTEEETTEENQLSLDI